MLLTSCQLDFSMPAPLQDMLHYWQSLPKDPVSGLPIKSSFNPAKVKGLLPHIVILEVVDYDTVMIRLTGTALDDLWNTNVTGKNTFDYVNPKVRSGIKRHYQGITDIPCGCYTIEEQMTTKDRPQKIHMLNLPLANKDHRPAYRIACVWEERPDIETFLADETRDVCDHAGVSFNRYIDLGFGIHEKLQNIG